MDWQFPAVGAAIVLSIAYIIRASLRTWSPKEKGCSSCGTCATTPDKPKAGRIELPMSKSSLDK